MERLVAMAYADTMLRVFGMLEFFDNEQFSNFEVGVAQHASCSMRPS
jgi:hypothetical protein